MRAYLTQMTTAGWIVVGIPALLLAYAVLSAVGPEIVRAVVPETVRALLRII